MMVTRTPTGLAAELWGSSEANSRSAGARKVRLAARDMFSDNAPGQSGEWDFTDAQLAILREELTDGPTWAEHLLLDDQFVQLEPQAGENVGWIGA
jgi:hypothetical protein